MTSVPPPREADLRIRCFEESDYPSAKALWERTEGVGLSSADERPAIASYLRRNPGLSFVAMSGDALVGTSLCGHDGRRGLIHHLAVQADHRRRGIGRRLLQAGMAALAAEGIEKCHLLVYRSNAPGQAFWQQLGAVERSELTLFSIVTQGGMGSAAGA